MLGKPERGHRAQASKAPPIDLVPEMTAAEAFEAIARACLEHFRRNLPPILERRDVEALHQARVALRRLRSALSIHKEMLAGGGYDDIVRELRWLAAELGRARDLDVLLERAGHGPLQVRLGEARAEAYAAVEAALRSARARDLMSGLAEWVAAGSWHASPGKAELRDRPVRKLAARALDRLRKRVKKRGRDFADLDDEARHKLRKSVKKLRYGAEFFRPLYPGKRDRRQRKRFLAALDALQDELGLLNDLRVARELLATLGLAGDRAARRLLRSGNKSARLAAAAERHAGLIGSEPFWR